MSRSHPILAALLVACAGIALYALMDAVMKGLTIALGVYVALFWRLAVGTLLAGGLYLSRRPSFPRWPVIRIHFIRSILVAIMAVAFFWGIARTPLAEAIALTFIAPLIALVLAGVFLKEQVGARSVAGSLLGLVGVGVILLGQMGAERGPEALPGMVAVLVSAVFYAVNLVVARRQAQLARPLEIAAFQNLFVLGILSLAAPFLLALPPAEQWPVIGLAAALGIVSLMLLSWAYARAEAQVLLSVEYTAFIWASLCGWWFFGEDLSLVTVAGTVLIVVGCILAARRGPSEISAT